MLAPGATVGNYRIEGVLGSGGMGVVYEATQLSLNRRVALKALRSDLARDPAFVERFRREGRVQASFHHPHAIEVYEALETPEGLFLAMRLERGATLADLLAEGRLDARRALRLLAQTAEALDAAHRAGLVHRDVKPQNVLVSDGGEAHLGDFGLTKAGDGTDLTASGAMLGTISYLAPEIVRGEPGTPASDRYAFCAMAFECLAGEVPFPRVTHAAVLYAHTSEPPPPISERRPQLPAALDRIFTSGLAKDPADRPDSAAELVAAMAAELPDERLDALGAPPVPVGATLPPRSSPSLPPAAGGRPRLLVLAAAGLAGLALGAGLTALVASARDDPGPTAPPPPALADRATVALGSDLRGSGRTVDCRGRAPSPAGPACTIGQVALPGRRSVVPEDGAIFGWAVRRARGEIALQVLRRQGDAAAQVARSQYETVNNGSPHRFATNLAVQAGDFIALEVTRGAAVGVAATAGATTQRWFPTRRGKPPVAPDAGPGSGLDGELLVRADYAPGAQRRLPAYVTGAAAARAPAGERVARRRLTFTDGTTVRVAVVELADRLVLDLMRGGRRVARMDLPDFRPGGRLINFSVLNYDDSEAAGEAGVEWVNDNSARVREHYYGVYPRALEFYD